MENNRANFCRTKGNMLVAFCMIMLIFLTAGTRVVAQPSIPYVELSSDGTKLTFMYGVKPTDGGTYYDLNMEYNEPAWCTSTNQSNVTSVEFHQSFKDAKPITCYDWFCNFSKLTDISGLEYLKTMDVTNMSYMFENCSGLIGLDLSGFNTAKVTRMDRMFFNCSQLTTILVDADKWNTEKVTSSSSMFYNCSAIIGDQGTTYNSSYWDKTYARADDPANGKPGYLTIGDFKIFYDLAGGTLPTGKTNPSSFTAPKNNIEIILNEPIKSNATFFGWIGTGISQPTKDLVIPINTVGHRTYIAVWEDEPFAELSTDGKTLTFKYGKEQYTGGIYYKMNNDVTPPLWENTSNQNNVTTVVFDKSFKEVMPTTCYHWFYKFTNLTNISGLEYLNTTDVTDMSYMFCQCRKLTCLDLSSFNTTNVANMSYMFYLCDQLTTILVNADKWNTEKVTSSNEMFYSCSAIIGDQGTTYNSLYRDKTYANVDDLDNGKPGYLTTGMFKIFYKLEGGILSDVVSSYPAPQNTSEFILEDPIKEGNIFDGWIGTGLSKRTKNLSIPVGAVGNRIYTATWKYEPYVELSSDGYTLTFKYGEKSNKSYSLNKNNTYPAWGTSINELNVTKVVFDESFKNARPTTCYCWFRDFTNLTNLSGLENLNTIDVTNMSRMFYNCSSLTSLDLRGCKTANVTDMSYMFYNCSNITWLDLSSFNTANVTNIEYMFCSCSQLTTILVDADLWNIENVTSSSNMLVSCSAIIGDKGTRYNSSYTDKTYACVDDPASGKPGYLTYRDFKIFYDLDGGSLPMGKTNPTSFPNPNNAEIILNEPEKEDYFFAGWTGANLTVPTKNVTIPVGATGNRKYTATWVTKTYVELSADGKTLTFKSGVPPNGIAYNLNTGTNMPAWRTSNNRSTVTNVVFEESFKDARPTTCYGWFDGFSNLTDISGLEYLNTENVREMTGMFYNCSGLTTLDLSNFTTGNVTSMAEMFHGCSNLSAIMVDVYKWDIEKVTSSGRMFFDCTSIIGNQGTTYNSSMTSITYACVDDPINGNPGYLTTGTYKMFYDLAGGVLPTGTTNPSSYPAPKNTSEIILQAPIKDSYVFGGWIGIDGKLNKDVVIPEGADGNRYYYAYWVDRIASDAYVELSTDGTTLTFKVGEIPNDGGTYYLLNTEWCTSDNKANVTKVVFDPSFYDCTPEKCAYWFEGFENLKRIYGLQYLRTDYVTTMSHMFSGCRSLITVNLTNFTTRNVVDMSYMFQDCETLIGVNLESFDTRKVENAKGMFWNCKNLISITKGINWTFGDNDNMFLNCNRFIRGQSSSGICKNATHEEVVRITGPDLMKTGGYRCPRTATKVIFDVSCKSVRPTTFHQMFFYCSFIKEFIGLENLNTERVTDMESMFDGCLLVKELDLHTFNTSSVTNMRYMFDDCASLTTLDLRSFDTRNVQQMEYMFRYCFNLRTILVSDKWKNNPTLLKRADYRRLAFYYCINIMGSQGSKYDHDNVYDYNYLKEDGGESDPGFLTLNNYRIIYDLDGGHLPQGKTNPEYYSTEEPISLVSPVKEGYKFIGWTRTDFDFNQENNLSGNQEDEEIYERLWFDSWCYEYKLPLSQSPTTEETIPVNGVGNRIYKANWEKQYTVTLPEHIEFVGNIEAASNGKYYFDKGTTVGFKVSDGYVVTDEITATPSTVEVLTVSDGTYSITVPASDVEIIAKAKKQVELSITMNDFDCRSYVAPVVMKGDEDVTEQCNLRIINSEEQDVTEIIETAIPGHYYLMVHYENDDEIGGGGAEFDIQKATPNPQVQAASNLVYDGNNQTLLMPATSDEFYAVLYSLSGDDDSYTANIEKIFGNDAKEYTIYYKVEGDDCYDEFAQTSLVAIINPKTITATHPDDYEIIKEYDGNTDITEDFNGIVTLSGVEAVDDGKVTIVCTSSYPSKDVVDYYEDDDLGTKSEELTFALSGERASNYVLAEASQTATYQLQIQPKMLSCWNAESVLSQAYELTKNYDGTSSVVIKDDYKTIQLSHGNCSDVLDGESVDITISGDYYDGFDYVSAPGNDYLLSLFASLPQKGNYGVYSDFGYYAASMFDYPSGGVIKAKVDFDNKGHGTAPATQYAELGCP